MTMENTESNEEVAESMARPVEISETMRKSCESMAKPVGITDTMGQFFESMARPIHISDKMGQFFESTARPVRISDKMGQFFESMARPVRISDTMRMSFESMGRPVHISDTTRMSVGSMAKLFDTSNTTRMPIDNIAKLAGICDTTRMSIDNIAKLAGISDTARMSIDKVAKLACISDTTRMSIGNIAKLAGISGTARMAIDKIAKLAGISDTTRMSIDNIAKLADITGLAALASAARTAPFGTTSSEAVRSAFGDWRSLTVPDRLAGVRYRDNFYVDHGFDTRLTAPPEPAFTQSLSAVGLIRPGEPEPDADRELVDVFEDETHEERSIRVRMQSAHSLPWRLERDLRTFIDDMMRHRFGEGWERTRLPGNGKMCQDWEMRRDQSRRKPGPAGRLIDFADFTDYEKVFTKRDNWKECFEAVFQDEQSIRESLTRLYPVRLATMHGRPITKIDRLFAVAEVTRLLVAIGRIKGQPN